MNAEQKWLANHYAAIAAGVNVGQLQRDKALRMSLALIKRGEWMGVGERPA